MNPLLAAVFLIFVLIPAQNAVAAQYLVEILERTARGGHRAVVRCDATGANFGADVVPFSSGMTAVGCSLTTKPSYACSDVSKPQLNENTTSQCHVHFAVVPRGNCSFSEKAYHVQTANLNVSYSALIVYNTEGQPPISIAGNKFADLVYIPVVMVTYECMQAMLGQYSAEKGYLVTIKAQTAKASPGYYDLLVKYMFPFGIIVGIGFIVLFIFLMIRLCRERQHRLAMPPSFVMKIPTKKY